MINKIKPNVFQLHFQTFGSTVYLIKLNDKNILIDSSSEENKQELLRDLNQLDIPQEKINTLIITHSHWDHIGNNDLFKNAKIITNENLNELPKELEPIKTPGHTQDSFCILYEDILFSGDTIFHEGGRGRTDLPGGNEEQILTALDSFAKKANSTADILKETAERIKSIVRVEDTVSRIGGDEFVVILPKLHKASKSTIISANLVAEKIHKVLADPFNLIEKTLYTSTSIGIVLFSNENQNIDQNRRAGLRRRTGIQGTGRGD